MLSRFPQTLRQSVAASILALLCVMAVGALQVTQLNQLKNQAKNASPETLQKEVESEKRRLDLIEKLPAFGFDNLLADWVFVGFLQYFGDDEVRKLTGYTNSPDYFEVIVDRDPRFLDVYPFLGTSISLYAAMPEKSIALVEKGLKSLSPQEQPKAYYVWRQKAIDELLFLGNAKAARQSFEKSVEWAKISEDPQSEYIGEISRQTAEFIASNPNSKNAQVSAWGMILSNPVDDRTRKIAIRRIEALGGKVKITPEGNLKIQLPKED